MSVCHMIGATSILHSCTKKGFLMSCEDEGWDWKMGMILNRDGNGWEDDGSVEDP